MEHQQEVVPSKALGSWYHQLAALKTRSAQNRLRHVLTSALGDVVAARILVLSFFVCCTIVFNSLSVEPPFMHASVAVCEGTVCHSYNSSTELQNLVVAAEFLCSAEFHRIPIAVNVSAIGGILLLF